MNKKFCIDNFQIKRSIYFFVFGQAISQLGTSMTSIAVVMWVYTEQEKVLASSLLTICNTIPYLLISLLGGVIADEKNKKNILLSCDIIAAFSTILILICYLQGTLYLWVLCIANLINGIVNAFQKPTSQVAITLLVEKKDFSKISGIQSIINAASGILCPILSALLLETGGLYLILIIDLITFIFASIILLFIYIPSSTEKSANINYREILHSIKEGIEFLHKSKPLLLIFVMYGILEFIGAISFDSMYSPLILSRTNKNELAVGIVSAFMAAGCLCAGIFITIMKPPKKKLPIMRLGSLLCLIGIVLFGFGRNVYWWSIVAFIGCFGAPIYQNYQMVLMREQIPLEMQGRIFSIHGIISQILSPIGYLSGGILADYIFEPFMHRTSDIQNIFKQFIGDGAGSGIALIFIIFGGIGIIAHLILHCNETIKKIDYYSSNVI